MNILWLSGILITSVISFGVGYSVVHNAEHKEITKLQNALDAATTQVNSVYKEAEKRAVSAKNETAMLNNKLEQAHNNASNMDIQLHVQNDKPCKPNRKSK